MYSRKLQQSILSTKHNLNQFNHQYESWWIRIFNKLPKLRAFQNRILSVPKTLKDESGSLIKVWAHHCECVLAHRLRRSQQMFSLYSKLWEEQALKQLMTNMRKQVTRQGKRLVLSAVGVAAYNWEENRIPDDEMKSHLGEIEYIRCLKDKTIKCQICAKPSTMDPQLIAWCDCEGRKGDLTTFENWTVFIEQQDLIVWRRPHPSGVYEYKVYGNYNDVTAEDFLSVQVDTDYRKQWDPTAVVLEIIERDCKPNGNGDLIYWEMEWPRLFANRDYIFKRRFMVNKEEKHAIIVSKVTEHPKYPKMASKHRVEGYWSSMVIKPYSEVNKPGIEFSLTYYDNPGVNIPQAVTNWVAYKAMPDFLTRLRDATRKYREYCKSHMCRSIYSYHQDPQPISNVLEMPKPEPLNDDELYEILKGRIQDVQDEGKTSHRIQDDVAEELKEVPEQPNRLENNKLRTREANDESNLTTSNLATPPMPGTEVLLSPTPATQSDQSYWKYLSVNYYIS